MLQSVLSINSSHFEDHHSTNRPVNEVAAFLINRPCGLAVCRGLAAVRTSSGVELYDASTLKGLASSHDQSSPVTRIRLTSNGQIFTSDASSISSRSVTAIDTMTRPQEILEFSDISDFDIHGHRIAIVTRKDLVFADVNGHISSTKSCGGAGSAGRVSFFSETSAAVTSHVIQSFDCRTGSVAAFWAQPGTGGVFTAVAGSGHSIVAGNSQGVLCLFDIRAPGSAVRNHQSQSGAITEVLMTMDGTVIAGSCDGSILRWRDGAKKESTIDGGAVVAMGEEGGVVVYGTDTGRLVSRRV